MVSIKNDEDIVLLREGGKRLACILQELSALVRPGITTQELEVAARAAIEKKGDTPSFLGYRPDVSSPPYPAALCTSINDEVVHGVPGSRVLKEGDIVGLDLGLIHKGVYLDSAITVPVGKVSKELRDLIAGTQEALTAGIAAARPGAHVGDIGAAVSAIAKKHTYKVIRDLSGHGVGYAVHEDPEVPNYGRSGEGEKLRAGMVIAIEPMFSLADTHIKMSDDGFTFRTASGSVSAHAEHTVLITPTGSDILTLV